MDIRSSLVSALRYRDLHLQVDSDRRLVALDGSHLILTRKEFELLALLVDSAGEVVSRGDILLSVWGYQTNIRTRTLDVHIRRLRKKLAAAGERYIETVFGVGYRFQPCTEATQAYAARAHQHYYSAAV